LQKGIKRGKAEVSYFTPFERYEVAKTTASLKDGFLTVTVPIKEEEKPIKIGIAKG
jgi:HSP20 family molecular chaperone IbpA